MKRQEKLNTQTLEMARKERDKVLKLQQQIDKANKEINRIIEENRWMSYVGSDFCEESTEEQEIDFFNNFKMLR